MVKKGGVKEGLGIRLTFPIDEVYSLDYMKKRLWKLLVVSFRLTVFALVAASLVAAIAFPSVTVRVPGKVLVEPTVPSEHKQLLAGTPDPDETTGKMGTGRKQQTAPVIVAVPPAPLKFDDGARRHGELSLDPSVLFNPVICHLSFNQTISLPRVSAKVARQLTLLGAKPSGTM